MTGVGVGVGGRFEVGVGIEGGVAFLKPESGVGVDFDKNQVTPQ